MTTYRAIKAAGLASAAIAMLVPSISMAEVEQTTATQGTHNLVHRVSHSLAEAKSYTRSGNAGYKWGKSVEETTANSAWADNAPARSGYKWANAESDVKQTEQSYAGNSNFQWGSMSFSEQSVYKWGLRNFSDQSVYKWGLRSFSDQTVYKWGLRNFSDQTVYKWGLRSFSDQTVYKWGLRNFSDQTVYKWGLRNSSNQAVYKWGLR